MHPPLLGISHIQVETVKVSEIGCLGYRENKCSLKEYWDRKKATGPWEAYKEEIVLETAPDNLGGCCY